MAVGVAPSRLLPREGAGQKGPALSSSSSSRSKFRTERSWVPDGAGRGLRGGWQPPELTPLWASLPPYSGGKAAGRPLIGPAGEGGGVWRSWEGGRRVCLFSILVFFPSSLSFPQVSCFSSSFPSACSLPSPALSGCEGMFRNSTAHASQPLSHFY